MAASIEPRGGLNWGWAVGESGWKPGMDENLLKLSRLAVGGLHVLDRDLTTPPSGPAAGSAYIIGGVPAGLWAASELGAAEGDIAVWDGAEWVVYTPAVGWQCYVEDEGVLTVFKGGSTGWSAGVAI